MNSKAMLFSILILFSSCYSYRSTAGNTVPLKQGEKVKLVTGDKKIKGKFVTVRNDSLFLEKSSGMIQGFSKAEVSKIKKRKFSWTKSVVIPGVVVGLFTYAAITLSDFDINFDMGY